MFSLIKLRIKSKISDFQFNFSVVTATFSFQIKFDCFYITLIGTNKFEDAFPKLSATISLNRSPKISENHF